ncbi:MAG: molybdopterin synthase sulfur carrier subunit, partial [Pseudomonas fluorescens]|nr:molybdopterin synthase sulfur carrier subunit [Pseudomonas fluorescens]
MNVTVKFFARYREALGLDSVKVEGNFSTVDDVRAL